LKKVNLKSLSTVLEKVMQTFRYIQKFHILQWWGRRGWRSTTIFTCITWDRGSWITWRCK